MLEKYAARMGGAQNHRMRLDDGLLIKDNHVAVNGSVEAAVARARAYGSSLPVQVEVDRIEQIEPALAAGADRLLLDNMPPPVLREAVALVAGRVPLEASGGVRLDTIRRDCRDRGHLRLGRADHAVGAGGRYRARFLVKLAERTPTSRFRKATRATSAQNGFNEKEPCS